MPTKAELETQLHRRERDPVYVSPAVAMPVMVTGGLLMIAVLYVAAQRSGGTFSPWIMAVPGVVGWVIAHFEARSYFTPRVYGNGPADVGCLLAAVCGAGAVVWEVWTARVGPGVTWPWLLLGAGIVTAMWWGLLWWAGRREHGPEPTPVVVPTSHEMPWEKLLGRADGRVTLTDVRYHRAGATLVCEPAQTVNASGVTEDEDVTFGEFAMSADRFATLAAAEYRRRTRIKKRHDPTCTDPDKMPTNCARPEPGSDDAEFLLHVTTRDVFTEHTVFQPSPGPRSIYQPIDLGEYEDATRILIEVAHKHGKLVGHSGAGKSVEANCWIARITEAMDALVWVCGTDKLIPLIWPWLRSWFAGQSVAPVLDYVAGHNITRVLELLADAYKLVCERNARLTDESRLGCSSREPAVFVFIEEMSHAVEFADTIETHDGMTCDVSTLVMLIARAGRSAGVQVVIMSQSALHGAAGDCASEIVRNIQIRVCLRTMEAHDGYRTIPALSNVDTTVIPLYTKIVQPAIETTRAMPGKAPELDGTKTIDPVAVRNATYRPRYGVEPESRLSEIYYDRWNPARHPELVRAVEKHTLQWRIPDYAPPVKPDDPTMDNHGKTGGSGNTVWTTKDDAALTALLDDAEPRIVGGFPFPNGDKQLARMYQLAAEIDADSPDYGEDPQPLPDPLDRIMAWFDQQEEDGLLAEFYLTDSIAAGIGHPDPKRLGTEINAVTGVRSRTAARDEDARRRKGWDTRALCEAATRLRFGM
jgi:hypothetical protein